MIWEWDWMGRNIGFVGPEHGFEAICNYINGEMKLKYKWYEIVV